MPQLLSVFARLPSHATTNDLQSALKPTPRVFRRP